jgi:hypothetical protein
MTPNTAAGTPTGMRGEIQKQWSKFTHEEVPPSRTRTIWWSRFRPSTRLIRRTPKRTSTRSLRVGSSDHHLSAYDRIHQR